MRQLIYLFFMLMITGISFGQSPKEILDKVNENYNGLNAVELQMTYKLYKGHSGTDIVHQYVGEFANNRKVSYRKVSDAEFIHLQEYALKINHKEGVIVVSDAIDLNAFDMDFKETIKLCKDITLKNMEGGHKEIDMFIADMNEIPYSKVSFEIDEHYWIQRINFYYASQSNFGTYFDQDLDFPRLEVEYSNLRERAKVLADIKIENYINIVKDKIYPTNPYADYEIMDLRKK